MSSGGPAFQVVSKLDYFAAHAPARPWQHYQPTVPPAPVTPMFDPVGNDGEAPTEDEARKLCDWRIDACWDVDEALPAYSYWCDSWRDYWIKLRAHKQLVEVEYDRQWPWFYAEAMLAESERRNK